MAESHFALPPFQVVRVVTEGMLTTVSEAIRFGQRVAVKTLRDRALHRWFERFADANLRLSGKKPNDGIVPCHEIGELNGRPFLTMDFIDGDDLGNGIADWATRPAYDILAVIRRVAMILDRAHANGVVHGLVHPRHVLIGSDGKVRVIGFAEWPPPNPRRVGNPLHLATEQMSAPFRATERTDVYGLAETAYWMFRGAHPFQRLRPREMAAAKRVGPPESARQYRSDLPEALDAVLIRGMTPRPGDRFSSPGEFAAVLSDAITGKSEPPRKWWHFWR